MTPLLLAAVLAGTLDSAGVKALVAQHKGSPVLVSFWASWCVPCIEEFPTLEALGKEQPDLAILSVSIDDPPDRPAVERVVAKQAPQFPVYIKSRQPDEEFINAIDRTWSGVVPALLFFDREGRKVKLLEGEQSRDDIVKALRLALTDAGRQPRAHPPTATNTGRASPSRPATAP